MLAPDGVYMINIIDVYESDAKAEEKAEADDQEEDHRPTPAKERDPSASEQRRGPRATAASSAPGSRRPG